MLSLSASVTHILLQPSGANWLLKLEQQTQENLDYNDHYYRQRLRALQAVDEMADNLFTRLEDYGLLGNTYIFYTSDNGFHIGQHRLQPGKSCGYEEDINVPLIVRGPGVPANHTTDLVTSHTDMAPTFFDILKIPQRDDFDGTAFPVTGPGIQAGDSNRREHVSVEYWGFAGGEGIYDGNSDTSLSTKIHAVDIHTDTLHENNTYKAIRILGPGYNLYYSVWCNNEHELYDMNVGFEPRIFSCFASIWKRNADRLNSQLDPGQLQNLLSPSGPDLSTLLGTNIPMAKVVARLDSLLFVLKSCKSRSCQRPWQILHPDGDVLTLGDALASRFDYFYEVEQQRVTYDFCSNGYLVEAEGPMWESQGVVYRDGLEWHQWV